MVFDRRFTAALTSIQRIRLERSNEQRASPAATGSLRPLDPVLLNGVELNRYAVGGEGSRQVVIPVSE